MIFIDVFCPVSYALAKKKQEANKRYVHVESIWMPQRKKIETNSSSLPHRIIVIFCVLKIFMISAMNKVNSNT